MNFAKLRRTIRSAITGVEGYGFLKESLDGWAYPTDLAPQLKKASLRMGLFDDDGVPQKIIPGVGLVYHPTHIAAHVLAHYNRWVLTGDFAARQRFLKMADWFMQAVDGCWYYHFDYEDIRRPWISGMAQGQGISVLARAHVESGEERYLDRARQAIKPLCKQLEDGGLRSLIDGKHPFIEEYPHSTPRHTLNGFMFALIGILDLARLDPDAAKPADSGSLIETLAANWRRWDAGFWTYYDLAQTGGRRLLVTTRYHRVHSSQMLYLAAVTGNPALGEAAERWEGFHRSPACRLRGVGGCLAQHARNYILRRSRVGTGVNANPHPARNRDGRAGEIRTRDP